MAAAPRTLVAGIGNVFFGDDGFGVIVAQRLAGRGLGEHVRVLDSGIRGLDLTYELLDDYAHVILVDALPRGSAPGTLCVLEPEIESLPFGGSPVQGLGGAHDMQPTQVLAAARALGARLDTIRIVGCEPGDLSAPELTPPVAAAVDGAVRLIEELITQFHS